jgi:hypothetical protein
MAKLTKQSKFEILTVVAVIILSIYFFVFFGTMSKEVPIDLSKNGSVTEFTVNIHEAHGSYRIYLIFSMEKEKRSKQNVEELEKFIGLATESGAAKNGTTIPIKVNIYRLEGKNRVFIREEIYETKGINSGYSTYSTPILIRNIDFYNLKRGKYLIVIEALDGFEYLKEITTKIRFYREVVK